MKEKEKEKKTKRIPFVSYLCYLLVVSVLFTGVTFSRYSAATSGDVGGSVEPFIAEYEIDDISSASFPNTDFWGVNTDSQNAAQSTPRTLRFTARNYQEAEDGSAELISNIPLDSSIRLHMPAELAQNLVLQVEKIDPANDEVQFTAPQIVLSDLIFEVTEENGVYTANKGAYASYENGGTRETAKSRDYSSVGGQDVSFAMSGGFDAAGVGSISAQAKEGEQTSLFVGVSSSEQLQKYSVGFRRGESSADVKESQLFLDLEKEILFYTVDIRIPRLMRFEKGVARSDTYVLYISLSEQIKSADYNKGWTTEEYDNDTGATVMDGVLDGYLDPSNEKIDETGSLSGGSVHTFNGATVTGYHFDASVHKYEYTSAGWADGGADDTTTVRVSKIYERSGGGYTGEVTTVYSHVAPISEDSSFNYIHTIGKFYTLSGAVMSPYAFTAAAQNVYSGIGGKGAVYGLCSNYFANIGSPAGDITLGEAQKGVFFISLAGIPDSPLAGEYTGAPVDENAQKYHIFESLSKSYATEMRVLFMQAPESEEGGDGQ